MRIIVNGRSIEFLGEQLSYEMVVDLAGEVGQPSVTYRGPRMGEGSLYPGCDPILLEADMVFDVVHTGDGERI
jgi:hypothetical protein